MAMDMWIVRRTVVGAAIALAGLLGQVDAAGANALEIGGKKSVTGLLAVATTNPDDNGRDDESTALTVGVNGAYTTLDRRFEFGGGLTIIGLFLPDNFDADTAVYNLTGQARINSNALGPDENVLLYVGGVAGLGIIDSDQNAIDDEVGVFGPKAGAEFYVTPRTAVQLEDQLLFDTEKGISNLFTVGFKLLFD